MMYARHAENEARLRRAAQLRGRRKLCVQQQACWGRMWAVAAQGELVAAPGHRVCASTSNTTSVCTCKAQAAKTAHHHCSKQMAQPGRTLPNGTLPPCSPALHCGHGAPAEALPHRCAPPALHHLVAVADPRCCNVCALLAAKVHMLQPRRDGTASSPSAMPARNRAKESAIIDYNCMRSAAKQTPRATSDWAWMAPSG
jgi:hypothetical protein